MTATTCSCDKWNQSIIWLIEAPTSRLSKTTETGVRVSRNTHAPLRLPGMLSTAGHCDQSRVAVAMICAPAFRLRHRRATAGVKTIVKGGGTGAAIVRVRTRGTLVPGERGGCVIALDTKAN